MHNLPPNDPRRFEKSVYEQLQGQRGAGAQGTVGNYYPLPNGKRCLEVGFGTGELARELINNGNSFYGMDVGKESSLAAIREGFVDKGTFLWMDASHDRYPFVDDFFDYAYCTECIEHLESPAHMFQEVKRTLKHDGIFVLSFPRPEDNFGYGGGEHAHVYPGFLLKHSFRYFVTQMYFKVIKYLENGSSAWYALRNIKGDNQLGIHEVIQGNYDENDLYGSLKEGAWSESSDPTYDSKTLHKLKLKTLKY